MGVVTPLVILQISQERHVSQIHHSSLIFFTEPRIQIFNCSRAISTMMFKEHYKLCLEINNLSSPLKIFLLLIFKNSLNKNKYDTNDLYQKLHSNIHVSILKYIDFLILYPSLSIYVSQFCLCYLPEIQFKSHITTRLYNPGILSYVP